MNKGGSFGPLPTKEDIKGMSEVNAELYEFMRERETGLYTENFKQNKTVYAFVRVEFDELSEFIEMVGQEYFGEGPMDIKLCATDVCIEVNDLIECDGHYLSSYRKCFSDYVWEDYEEKIKEMEAAYR